jgi:peptidoglycan/LPS O-acetylase OafA/YrhL
MIMPYSPTDNPSATPRSAAVDSLRSLLTLLVVAHHAVLAYFVYAPPTGAFDRSLYWAAFPIIDPAKSPGVDALVLWNDSFFMALLLLLSGLFAGPSLRRKGAIGYIGDRFMRLGVPFVAAAALLAPLAYYPAYLQRQSATEAAGFVDAWLKLDNWPAGPAWFLWVLLGFSALTSALHAVAPRALDALGAAGDWCRETTVRVVTVWMLAALAGYFLIALVVSPMHWWGWGPFFVQTSRVALYAVYFFLGVAFGWSGDRSRLWLAPDGALARRWVAWQIGAGAGFVAFVAAVIVVAIKSSQGARPLAWAVAAGVLMVVSGVLTSSSLLAYCARRRSVETPLWASLRRNAFGIYLVHYPIVSWLQFGFLQVTLPGWAKAGLVTLGAVGISWALAAGLRRLPGLRRVL